VFFFCCVYRTVRFWDLEKFQVVSCIEEEATPVRYIKFLPQCTRQGLKSGLGEAFLKVRLYWGQVCAAGDVAQVSIGSVAC